MYMSDIEEELDNKEVERIKITTEPLEKKSKKVRSPAQIAAFNKAQETRRKNVLTKKENQLAQKIELKQKKKEVKQQVIEEMNKPQVIYDKPQVTKPVVIDKPEPEPTKPRPREVQSLERGGAPIINNYYYGTNKTSNKKSKRRKKKIVESSSEEDDSDDSDYEPSVEIKKTSIKPVTKSIPNRKTPIIDTPEDNPYQTEINRLKFSYA